MPRRGSSADRAAWRGISLPLQVAILTLLVLIISVAVTVVLFLHMNNMTFSEAKLNVAFWVTTCILVFLIPLVLLKIRVKRNCTN